MFFRVSKTFGHDLGISCAYRQWRADSHCAQLHGYALAFVLHFETSQLDDCGWVIDFGSMKPLKQWLLDTFDHQTLVAKDDPQREWFEIAAERHIINLQWVERTGCEAIAAMVAGKVEDWLVQLGMAERVRLVAVEVAEHGANRAAVEL
jgi:6-pyruvoyltetrahydropterin/6-carboxytetrahydropterin synthase